LLYFCDLSGSEKPTDYDDKYVEDKKVEVKKIRVKMNKRASVGNFKLSIDLTKL